MEEIVTCNICANQFDNAHFIPKVLECGHTFCSPCLSEIYKKNPICPNCRAEIEKPGDSFPINYVVLNAVDIYISSNSLEKIVDSIDVMKKKCIDRKDVLLKKSLEITSTLEVLDKCLEVLNDLKGIKNQEIITDDAEKILSEMEDEIRKTDDVICCDDVKIRATINLSSFKDSKDYLAEIFRKVENNEKVFAVNRIDDKIKYGKVLLYRKKLVFLSQNLAEVPTNSSLIRFDELKQCASSKNFHTFLKICCNEENETRVLIIKMLDREKSHHFIKLCTGEYGPSYKGVPYWKGFDGDPFKAILRVENFAEEGQKINRKIDFNFSEDEYSGLFKCEVNKIYLSMPNKEGCFEIISASETFETGNIIVGKVIFPTNLDDCINYSCPSSLKIIDCGIMLKL